MEDIFIVKKITRTRTGMTKVQLRKKSDMTCTINYEVSQNIDTDLKQDMQVKVIIFQLTHKT